MSFPMKRKARGRTVRRVPGTMNKTEQAFAALLDDSRRRNG